MPSVKINNPQFNVPKRPYSVISFRMKGNAKITAADKTCSISEGDVLYVPQNVDYTAQYTDTETDLPKWFLEAVAYMNESFRDNGLSLEQLCRETGISQSAFRSLFKAYYQKTPIDYIIDLRLEYARSLIAEGMSVENAAYESGFNDPKYFARTVKKRMGCTPRYLIT